MNDLSGIRICLATSGHEADDDRVFFKEARSLVRAGAEVTLLCAQGKKLPAQADGVRFAQYPGGGGLKERLRTVGRLEAALAEQACDAIHCHEPDSLVAALRVKRRRGVKVVFDSHECWAGVAAARFPRPLWPAAMAAYRACERRWIDQCDAAFGASLAISEDLAAVLGPERVATLLNVPAADVFGAGAAKAAGPETILCHDGTLTFARGLKVMAEAVRLAAQEHRVVWKIVGDVFGAEKAWLEAFVAKHGLERTIVRTGWLPYAEVGRAIAPCHVGLIGFLPSPNHEIAAPNKCFNYLLYGIPIVGPDFPRSHFAVLAREGCALLADSTSPEAYAAAIGRMIADQDGAARMAAAARRLSETKYRWEHMEPILCDAYRRLFAGQGAP